MKSIAVEAIQDLIDVSAIPQEAGEKAIKAVENAERSRSVALGLAIGLTPSPLIRERWRVLVEVSRPEAAIRDANIDMRALLLALEKGGVRGFVTTEEEHSILSLHPRRLRPWSLS